MGGLTNPAFLEPVMQTPMYQGLSTPHHDVSLTESFVQIMADELNYGASMCSPNPYYTASGHLQGT